VTDDEHSDRWILLRPSRHFLELRLGFSLQFGATGIEADTGERDPALFGKLSAALGYFPGHPKATEEFKSSQPVIADAPMGERGASKYQRLPECEPQNDCPDRPIHS
jgi:hypothetical protein